jgi:hypothetical protein
VPDFWVKRPILTNQIAVFFGEKGSKIIYSMISSKTRTLLTQRNIALNTTIERGPSLKSSVLIG